MATSTALAKLEPFLLMAKSAKGAAAAKLIESATAAPGVFVFAELLETPSVQQLSSSEQKSHLDLLNLFSYGTYTDYKQNQSSLPSLNNTQITKLKQLSIITLAADRRILPYNELMAVLEIPSIRALEDLIIDAIYAELLRGKLDQKNQQFEVQYTLGRDLRPGQLEQLLAVLQDWSNRTSSVMATLDSKLAKIETEERDKKQQLLAYDADRQRTVNELVAAQQNNLSANSSKAVASSSAANAKRAALSQLTQVTPAGLGASQTQGQMQQSPIYEDEMDVDPSPLALAKEASRKKPASSSPTTGGGGPPVRKRTRGGQ